MPYSRSIYRQATRTRHVWDGGGASDPRSSTLAIWTSGDSASRLPLRSTRPGNNGGGNQDHGGPQNVAV
jgi:hypothetical protein